MTGNASESHPNRPRMSLGPRLAIMLLLGFLTFDKASGQTPADRTLPAASQLGTPIQPRSGDMAKWEAGFRTWVVVVGLGSLVAAAVLPFFLPYIVGAFPRVLAWSFGLSLRCLVPSALLAAMGVATGALILADLGRRFLAVLTGLPITYFEAAAKSGSAFTQPGILFGVGAGAPLAAQPALVAGFLVAMPLIGGGIARFAYWVSRFKAPVGEVKK